MKTRIFTLLAVMMFASISVFAQGVEPIKGDVNGDGRVDVADIANIIDIMAKGTNNPQADVNKDGTVDVADIAAIIDIMASSH
jgi:hypothetical protein